MTNWGAYLFAVGVNLFLSPFIVHRLGNAAYGIWILLASLVGYLGLLDLGVRGAVTRYIAKFHKQARHDEATRIASSALVVFTTAGLLAIAASVIIAAFVTEVFQVPERLEEAARVVVILGGVSVAVSLVSGVFGGVVVGRERFDHLNAIEVAVQAFRAVSVVVALSSGMGLVALANIQLGVSCLRGYANFWLSRRVYPELRPTFGQCDRNHLGMILSFSVAAFLLQTSGALILFTDSVVIGTFFPVSMITFFAIAANLTEYARAPVSGISQTLTPWASTLEAGKPHDELRELLLTGARISTLVVLPIVLTFMVRGKSFIGLWMGSEYAEPAGQVLVILSLALWFAVGYQAIVATMMGISKHAGIVPAFLTEAVCNIGLSVLWIQSYGIVGVAWGTAGPRLAAALLFAPWYVRRVLGIPIRRFWLTVWMRPAMAMVPFALASYAIERWWHASNLVVYFAQVGTALPLAALGAWAICLTQSEKQKLDPSRLLARLARHGAG